MKVKKEVAQGLTYSKEVDGFTVIDREIKDHRRWSVDYLMTVEKDGKYYQHGYSQGATESQDETPFEYEDDEIEFWEVKKVEKTVTVFEKEKEQWHH